MFLYKKTILFIIGFVIISTQYAISDTNKIPEKYNVFINQIKNKDLQQNKNTEKQTTNTLKTKINNLNTFNLNQLDDENIIEYQKIIDNFITFNHQLYENKKNENTSVSLDNINILFLNNRLNKNLLDIKDQITNIKLKLQQEQNHIDYINKLIQSLPTQQQEEKKNLKNIEQEILSITPNNTLINQNKFIELQAKKIEKKIKLMEIEITQLNINNQQEKSKIHIEIFKKQYNQLNKRLEELKNQSINTKQNTNKPIQTKKTNKQQIDNNIFDKNIINKILLTNKNLYNTLNQQIKNLNYIISQQEKTNTQIIQIQKLLHNLLEQSQWLNKSPTLGDILRSQLIKLSKIPKTKKLDNDMIQWKTKKIQYENQINEINTTKTTNEKIQVNKEEQKILNTQLHIQKDLLNILIIGCDRQILELTKLKISQEQLKTEIKKIRKTIHHQLFWIADTNTINLSYLINVYQDLKQIFNYKFINEIQNSIKTILINKETIIPIIIGLLLFRFKTSSQNHYYTFLSKNRNKIQQKKQNYLFLTMNNILWSIIISLTTPILWITIGYILKNTWTYSIITVIGDAIYNTIPIIWIYTTILYFSHPNGLFTTHLQWPISNIKQALKHHKLLMYIIITLIILFNIFAKFNDQKFYNTISRICLIALCPCISIINNNIKKSKLPLYFFNQKHKKQKILNKKLWNIIIYSPLLVLLFTYFGYLTLAKTLIIHFETSIIIWITIIITYNITQHGILIQYKNFFIEQKKNKQQISINKKNNQKNKINTKNNIHYYSKQHNLKLITNKSLNLIKFILITTATTFIITIWSELHPIFNFLEKNILWQIPSIMTQNNLHPITLKSILISIIIFYITIKLVKNLPSLCELILLQTLNIKLDTKYAIIKLTKYLIMLLGGLIGFSFIGIEWTKLQWLIAAIGVGLGFGLQEIFANFISGLMILFEKPIRIGDTITIRNLTGHVTRINTRATIITDRDHKEIIIPNKEFITKKFTNWSLTDTITRVVLKIPAPSNTNIENITNILLQTIKTCSLVLKTPQPEIYLIDVQQGIPLFEIRLYAENMTSRMPLKHQIHILILKAYKQNGFELPFPHFQIIQKQNIN